MRRLRGVLAMGMAFTMLMGITGCGDGSSSGTADTSTAGSTAGSSGETNAGSGDSSGKRIALLVKQLGSSYWTDLEQAVKDQCEEYGWEVETLCPVTADSNEEQIQLIEQSLLDPPDAYILAPADAEGIAPAIEQINAENIPIVCVTNKIAGEDLDYVTYVGVEYVDLAAAAAQELVNELGGSGKILMLEGVTGSSTSQDIKEGADGVFAENSGIEVLDSQPANYQRQEALTVTQNLLQKYQDVDAIFASNGEMALGAAEAVRQAGREGIKIAALNCSKELVQAIIDGTITFTADDVPWKMGQQSVVAVKDYFDGAEVEKERPQECVIVNQDNLDEYKEKYGIS